MFIRNDIKSIFLDISLVHSNIKGSGIEVKLLKRINKYQ